MLIKPALSIALALFVTPLAWAQQALDLSLPAEAPATTASTTPADPPGTYFGDTSGKPGSVRRPGQDVTAQPDDGSAKVWGSVTTSVGHTKGQGTFWGNSANVNVAKSFGENNQGRIIFSADVGNFEGPGLRMRDACDHADEAFCQRPALPSR